MPPLPSRWPLGLQEAGQAGEVKAVSSQDKSPSPALPSPIFPYSIVGGGMGWVAGMGAALSYCKTISSAFIAFCFYAYTHTHLQSPFSHPATQILRLPDYLLLSREKILWSF